MRTADQIREGAHPWRGHHPGEAGYGPQIAADLLDAAADIVERLDMLILLQAQPRSAGPDRESAIDRIRSGRPPIVRGDKP